MRILMGYWCAAVILFGTLAPAIAETFIPLRKSRTEKINSAIDMLATIKAATARSRANRETETYKQVGTRLVECSFAYDILSKSANNDEKTKATFGDGADIYKLVATFIFPAPIDDFKQAAMTAQRDLLHVRESQNEKQMFYLLRNCADFSKAQDDVVNAIAELGM